MLHKIERKKKLATALAFKKRHWSSKLTLYL